LPEALNAKNEQFGMDRVTAHIRNASGHSAEKLNNEMFESVKQFSAGKEVEDDITCVITRIV
jgi:serine phosphatase RsbU (regulator of sigma subunit)